MTPMVQTVMMSLLTTTTASVASEACQCKESWVNPHSSASEGCKKEQNGCTNCDNDRKGSWCMVSNPNCLTDHKKRGWSYCAASCKAVNDLPKYGLDVSMYDEYLKSQCLENNLMEPDSCEWDEEQKTCYATGLSTEAIVGMSTQAIVGIVLGAIALLALIGGTVFLVIKRKWSKCEAN